MFYDRCYSFSVWIWISLTLICASFWLCKQCLWRKWHLLFWSASLVTRTWMLKYRKGSETLIYMGFLVSHDAKQIPAGPALSQWKVRALDLHGYKEREKPRTWGYDRLWTCKPKHLTMSWMGEFNLTSDWCRSPNGTLMGLMKKMSHT